MSALNWSGVEEGRWIQIVGTALKIGLLVAVVLVAVLFPVERGAATAIAQRAPPAEPISLFSVLLGLQFIVAVYDG